MLNSLGLKSLALMVGLNAPVGATLAAQSNPLLASAPPTETPFAVRDTSHQDVYQITANDWRPYSPKDTTVLAATVSNPDTSEIPKSSGPIGQSLVEKTVKAANARKEKKGQFFCYRDVKAGIAAATGVQLTGNSAYQAADQLASSDKFRELHKLSPEQLKELPAGAVMVWNKGQVYDSLGNARYQRTASGKKIKMVKPHGHIAVAVGQHSSKQLDALRAKIDPQNPDDVKLEVSDRLRDLKRMESYGTRWEQGAGQSSVRVFLPVEVTAP